MGGKLSTGILCAVAVCSSVMAEEGGMWWNDGWRFRTTVVRPTPWRDDAPRPVEVAVDFPRLLAGAGIGGDFAPASLRVVEPRTAGVGVEVPFAYRTEYDPEAGRDCAWLAWTARPNKGGAGVYHIYFDTRDCGIALADYGAHPLLPENLIANPGFEDEANGLPAGWTATPVELVQLGRFAHTTGRQSLKVVVDEKTPAAVEREVTLSQKVNVRDYAGQEMVFECDLYAESARYGAPVTIELQQFRADGSRMLEWAVEPRWLTIELAQGHLVQFRERGRFSPEAATVNVQVRFRCQGKDADTEEPLTGPESFFTVWLDRLVVRPGERWPWPAEAHGGYVAGALEEAPFNRAFEFTGQRRLAFNGASEGTLTSGTYNPNPRSVHWGLEAGTMEFWCRPSWGADDARERIFFEGSALGHRIQSRLSKVQVRGKNHLKFAIADADRTMHELRGPAPFQAGQWHHVAATWDFPKAHLQLFFDGKRVAEEGPGTQPWPSSLVATGGKTRGIGISSKDTRSLPMQAFIGGDRDSRPYRAAEAAIDEFRISDVPRYADGFTPPRREFEPDEHTRALFHFENERDGVHDADDRFVRGHLACELPRREETAPLDVRTDAGVEHRAVLVRPHPGPEVFQANRAENRLMVRRPFRALPDPRFVEYRRCEVARTVRGEEDAFVLDVGGDFEPLMRSITFQRAEDAGGQSTLLPRWRANDNVVPFSVQSIAATLGVNAVDDVQRARDVFNYALKTSNYFNAGYCETLPTRHRPRVAYTLLKALNIYPFDQCGPMNHTLRKVFLSAGISSNNAIGTHHQFEQAFYLGRWRLFDLSARVYWLDRDDATVVSRRGLEQDPYLKLRQGGNFRAWIRGIPYEARFGTAERPHNMDFPLRPGEQAAVCWHNEGRWIELTGEREPIPLAKIPPCFGNGAIVYTPTAEGGAATLENMAVDVADDDAPVLHAQDPAKAASLIYHARCPYIFSDASVTGAYEARKADAATLSLSFDRGKSWTRVWRTRGKTGEMAADLLKHVTARYEYWLKLDLTAGGGARVTGLRVRTTFVASPLALPGRLSRGQNRITFVGGPPAVPVKTVCRWVERHKTDLGVSLNALSYYMNGDESHRNLLIVPPDRGTALVVALQGRRFLGEVALDGLPAAWLEGAGTRKIATEDPGRPATAEFRLKPAGAAPGEIRGFDVVVHEEGRERRVAAQVLVAQSPLVREAEAADEVTGAVAPVDLVEASGAKMMTFAGNGTLCFALSTPKAGKYALWLRARWEKGSGAGLTLALDDAKPRALRAIAMIGFTDWTSRRRAHTKMFHSFGEQYGHWSWYRIPAVALAAGEHRLTLGAEAGASFDALALLPQNAAMDRAAMNLFQNWNYAPWQNPL